MHRPTVTTATTPRWTEQEPRCFYFQTAPNPPHLARGPD